MAQNVREKFARAKFHYGKFVRIEKNSKNNHRTPRIRKCRKIGYLNDYRDDYYKLFKSFEPQPGAIIITDYDTQQQFVCSGRSMLDEVEKLALPHAKPPLKRSAIENAVVNGGQLNKGVQVVPLKQCGASELRELEATLIMALQPSFNKFVDFLPDDVVNITFHSEQGDYGPQGEITVSAYNKTRMRARVYPSIDAAQKVFWNSPQWFLRMAAEHRNKTFEMRLGPKGKLEPNFDTIGMPTSSNDSDDEEEENCSPDLNILSDDPTSPDWWMSGGELTLVTGPEGEMMILDNTTKMSRAYRSALIASVDLEISPRTLENLIYKHKDEGQFRLTVAEVNELRRARYNELLLAHMSRKKVYLEAVPVRFKTLNKCLAK